MIRNIKGTNPIYTFKLSLITTSTGVVITETDSITTMVTYLSTYTLVAGTTLRFNSSDNFVIASTLNFANNTAFILTLTPASGYFPSIDGQNTLLILFQMTGGKIVINGIFFKNALVQAANNGQAMIRVYGPFNNLTVTNCKFSHGFCAIKGSDNISNITITDCNIYQVDNGSFVFGNTANVFPDITNVNINRCQFIDDLNGGIIPNGYGSKYSPSISLGSVDTLSISNCIFQQTQDFAIAINSAKTVNISNIQCWNTGIRNPGLGIINIGRSTGITVMNCFISPNISLTNSSIIISSSSMIKIYYCTVIGSSNAISLQQCQTLLEIAGCILLGGFNYSVNNVAPYIGTIANDYVSENNNVLTAIDDITFSIGVYQTTYPTQFAVRISFSPLSFSDYKSIQLRGQNSQTGLNSQVLITDSINTNQIVLPSKYSLGYKLVQSQISTITTDLTGKIRTYPTNAGAFN